jgi:hypothetical protein
MLYCLVVVWHHSFLSWPLPWLRLEWLACNAVPHGCLLALQLSMFDILNWTARFQTYLGRTFSNRDWTFTDNVTPGERRRLASTTALCFHSFIAWHLPWSSVSPPYFRYSYGSSRSYNATRHENAEQERDDSRRELSSFLIFELNEPFLCFYKSTPINHENTTCKGLTSARAFLAPAPAATTDIDSYHYFSGRPF